jgi:succinate dehydrogenase hydrophobic anchor subunit
MIFLSAIFVAIILISIKLRKDTDVSQKLLFYRMNGIRGLFALEVFIGHSYYIIDLNIGLSVIFQKFLIASVGFFFAMSGWGLSNSFRCKENYLKGFLLKKISYLLLISLIVYIFSVTICYLLCGYGGYSFQNISELTTNFIKTTNFFIFELILFYILFYHYCPNVLIG